MFIILDVIFIFNSDDTYERYVYFLGLETYILTYILLLKRLLRLTPGGADKESN